MLLRKRTPRRGLEDFAAYLEYERQRSPETVKNYVSALTRLEARLGMAVDDIMLPQARRFLYSDASIPTKRIAVIALRQYDKWQTLEGRPPTGLHALPVPKYQPPKRPPMDALNTIIVLDRVALMNPRQARVSLFGLYAGCRLDEAARMEASNVYGDRLTFIGKGGKKRTVPLHPELEARLEFIFSETVGKDSLETVWVTLRNELGVVDLEGKPATTHTLRRTFGNHLYNVVKTPWEMVAKMLGHEIGVTERYPEIYFDPMKDAVLAVDYYANAPGQLSLF